MYDFYKNPPQSKADLRQWLTDWLQKPEKETIFQVNNELFSLEFGFVRAGYSHEVLQSQETGEYIWWVMENCNEIDYNNFPSQRFPSYEALLDSVIDYYYTSWKLTA